MERISVSSLLIVLIVAVSWLTTPELVSASFNRFSFPQGFLFGTAAASYQYEGAYNEDGKGFSIWDNFTHQFPERIADHSNGDVAVEFYHRYKEDVKIMKNMGLDAFRFSISWARLLPRGSLNGGINQKGVQFYNNLIDELLSHGVKPFVTLFHWDLPQPLEDEYGGFLSSRIVEDYKDFAELCFKEFGDRVKHWITLNEPWSFSTTGYNSGIMAPGRCSKFMNPACQCGNSATEPYIVAHNLLLSHAAVVKLYKQKYQTHQGGKIGITLISYWFEPYSKSKADKEAAKRAFDFMFGWYMEPVSCGEYPTVMRRLVGQRLPIFTGEQSEMLKGSFDFIGVNYYSAFYASNVPSPNFVNVSYSSDSLANLTGGKNGKPIGPSLGSVWIQSYPQGFYNLLVHTKETYNNPTIYVTENGIDQFDLGNMSVNAVLNDTGRVQYYSKHIRFLRRAIENGVNVKGYFAWSLLDNFEWAAGHFMRYGMNMVDYKDGLRRIPKKSAIWFKKFLQKQK